MSKLPRPDLAAYGLVALLILCITGLLLVSKAVPDYLPLMAMGLLGTGAGISLNTPNGSETVKTSSSRPAPAAARIPAQPAPVSTPVAAP